jgi:probable rRNA maturation factor
MQLNLEINNQSHSPIKKAFFDTIWKTAFLNKALNIPSARIFNLSLALVSRAEIKKLNRLWRQKNAVTDVLSFAEFKSLKEIKANREKEVFLGEIILCYDDIKAYAEKNNLKIKAELAKVFLHGILHLLGFRHGQAMFILQDKLLTKLRNKLWKE